MAQSTQYTFSYKEVVTALIKEQNLHEGIWMLTVNFGIGATNINNPDKPDDLNPAAIVPVTGIGLHKVDEVNALSVDAAIANPPS